MTKDEIMNRALMEAENYETENERFAFVCGSLFGASEVTNEQKELYSEQPYEGSPLQAFDKLLKENAELQQMYLTESYEKAKLVGQIDKMNGYLKELFSYYDDYGCDIPTINKARKYLETGVAE